MIKATKTRILTIKLSDEEYEILKQKSIDKETLRIMASNGIDVG